MSTQEYVVEVQPEFLERQAKAPPIHAVHRELTAAYGPYQYDSSASASMSAP